MSLSWISVSGDSILPSNAVVAGHDVDGAIIYVGRAYHEGDLVPAKAIPSKQIAYIPFLGEEIPKHDYNILCGDELTWVEGNNGYVPSEAVSAGVQANGEPLYVGRARICGSLVTGKILPSHNCIYVPFDGVEHSITQYEVLVSQQRPKWIRSSIYESIPEGAILAGHDQDQSPIYIGRAWHEGDQLPAKVLPSKQECYVSYDGEEIPKENFDVLCNGNVSWVHYMPMTRSVPPFALTAGITAAGEPLYVGRAYHDGSLTVGKLQISHGVFYIPFGGCEVAIDSAIEVLVEH